VIVAIEAASTELSIAVLGPDSELRAEDAWTSEQRQSAELLPRLLSLLASAGVRVTDVRLVAVGTGPGSFTGLRVAMALAKGLAVGLDRPLVGIGSLDAWLETDAGAVAAVGRAGAHEAYVLLRDADRPLVADESTIRDRLGERRVVAPAEVADAFGLDDAVPPRAAAAAIARRARQRADADDVRTLEPAYVRAPRGLDAEPAEEVRWL
jgi:tRNA threonylcarbamoyl adenosine modification protein YeaZ